MSHSLGQRDVHKVRAQPHKPQHLIPHPATCGPLRLRPPHSSRWTKKLPGGSANSSQASLLPVAICSALEQGGEPKGIQPPCQTHEETGRDEQEARPVSQPPAQHAMWIPAGVEMASAPPHSKVQTCACACLPISLLLPGALPDAATG